MAEKWWLSRSEDGDTDVIRGEYPDGEPQMAEELVVVLNALEADKAALLEAAEEISKMGRVCEEFEICTHPACADSSGAVLVALDVLSRFRSEGAEATKATPKTCMFCFIEDPVACVYKGEAFCGLGAEVEAGE